VEPGHRGLLFDPKNGGLKQDILQPGYYSTGSCFLRSVCPRIEEYDVSYASHKELIQTVSSEGLVMSLAVGVMFRPVLSEIYQLHTEIGPNYHEEVVAPEFRSAARGVLARHSYIDLRSKHPQIEEEIKAELKRRIHGKHVEISSITIEGVNYAPEIAAAIQRKLVGEQEAVRRKSALLTDSVRKRIEIEQQADQVRLKAEATIRQKKNERILIEQQAEIDKVTAEAQASLRVTRAKARAEEIKLQAKGELERRKALAASITPLVVQMRAYDALAQLAGSGATIMMGDYSRAPYFLPASMGPMAPRSPWLSAPRLQLPRLDDNPEPYK
jgi:regulator of protease activity HflC (stomatin/prohibitin superfamily)